VSITHTYNEDLYLYLVAPNNTVFLLSGFNGSSGDNYSNAIFDDNVGIATIPYPGIINNISGTFQTDGFAYGTHGKINSYAGAIDGVWKLYVIDRFSSFTGSITNFTLTVNQTPSVNLTFHNFTTNNTSTTGTTLTNTNITINNQTTFTSGRLYTSEAFRVNYIAGSSTSLANSNSYIVGWARKTGNTTFEFPLGNDGGTGNKFAAPIRFTPTSGSAVTDHFTATYRRITPNTGSPNDVTNVNTGAGLNTAPYPIATKQASIDHVSNVEYWILERTNGAAQGTVTLSYDNIRSGGTAGLATDLLVCRWNKTTPIWENKGNSGASSSGGFTYIASTAGTFTAFSPITLGSTTKFNVLPVTWISFDITHKDSDAILKWQTQNEQNNDYFEVERSFDGINFVKIAQIAGTKNSVTEKYYSFTDKNVNQMGTRIIYYRIKQVDIDKQNCYTQIKNVVVETLQMGNFITYPNPFSDNINVDFTLTESEFVELELVDNLGQVVYAEKLKGFAGKNNRVITTNNFASGIYLLRLQTQKGLKVCKVVKQ
jgi:subtilisin-like proprotein convertase family protein